MLKRKSLEKFTAVCLFFLMLPNQGVCAQPMTDPSFNIPTLVLDEDPGLTMPGRFRTSKDEFKTVAEKVPTREGLDSLQIIGSAQFSKATLENALKKIDGPVWIVDLRKESHGFVNGTPISWYSRGNQSNISESDDNIIRQEQMIFNDVRRQGSILVAQILKKKDGVIIKSRPIDMKVSNAQTESSLINHLNLSYLRLGVLDHHRPSDDTVDHFIDFVKTLPPDAWLYFHCRGGKGRTSTFMVMYDMMKNAKKVSMDDIITRQTYLGSSDLVSISDLEEDAWKREDMIERKDFIAKFYQYAKDSRGLGKKTWTEWIAKNK